MALWLLVTSEGQLALFIIDGIQAAVTTITRGHCLVLLPSAHVQLAGSFECLVSSLQVMEAIEKLQQVSSSPSCLVQVGRLIFMMCIATCMFST